MNNKKLYLSDLDDTLVEDGHFINKELALKFDEILKEKNIDFMISSARSFNSIKNKTKELKTPIKIISRNGAILYNEQNKIVFFIEISKTIVFEVVNFAIKEKLCPVIISIKDNKEEMFCISEYKNKEFLEMTVDMEINFINQLDIYKIKHVVAIYCFGKVKESKKYDIANVKVRVYKNFLHVSNISCNKGTLIKYLRENYLYSSIISFGNDENDIEMLDNSNVAYFVYKDENKINKKYNNIKFDNGEKIINIIKGSEFE